MHGCMGDVWYLEGIAKAQSPSSLGACSETFGFCTRIILLHRSPKSLSDKTCGNWILGSTEPLINREKCSRKWIKFKYLLTQVYHCLSYSQYCHCLYSLTFLKAESPLFILGLSLTQTVLHYLYYCSRYYKQHCHCWTSEFYKGKCAHCACRCGCHCRKNYLHQHQNKIIWLNISKIEIAIDATKQWNI